MLSSTVCDFIVLIRDNESVKMLSDLSERKIDKSSGLIWIIVVICVLVINNALKGPVL